jgi:hypothetical protein
MQKCLKALILLAFRHFLCYNKLIKMIRKHTIYGVSVKSLALTNR